MVRISVDLDRPLYDETKAFVDARGLKMTALGRIAIREYLDRAQREEAIRVAERRAPYGD